MKIQLPSPDPEVAAGALRSAALESFIGKCPALAVAHLLPFLAFAPFDDSSLNRGRLLFCRRRIFLRLEPCPAIVGKLVQHKNELLPIIAPDTYPARTRLNHFRL